MRKKVLVELLDEHAAELQRGEDRTAEIRTTFKSEPPVVGELLGLAQRLRNALPQVEPRAAFVARLKARLLARIRRPAYEPVMLADQRERRLLYAVAGLGALMYLASIAAFSVRMLVYLFSLVGLVVGLRKSGLTSERSRRPAVPA